MLKTKQMKSKLLATVKLKHLNLISQEQVNYKEVMTEVLGYKNNWFTRKFKFIKTFAIAYSLSEQIRNIDPAKLTYDEKCSIKKPANIDFISFQAMMELQALLGATNEQTDLLHVTSQAIAIACYSENNEGDYISEGQKFDNFKQRILNSSFIEMFGLFNWIVEDVTRSSEEWTQRFFSVQVEDMDYDRAGGSRMSQFNVIMSIKSICADFNLPFKEAWQLSYNLVQTNSYAKATQNHIQENMRMIKESKMRSQRND